MGKYMRKSRVTGDAVTVMEVHQRPTTSTNTTLGVRTRAKSRALQRLNSSSSPSSPSPTCNPGISSSTPSSLCYLQLRSRRLEKPALPVVADAAAKEKSPKPSLQRKVKRENEEREELGFNNNQECCEVVASSGDNCLDSDPLRDRSTRESTPCSLTRDSNVIGTSGSTPRKTCSTAYQRVRNATHRNIPTTNEMEEFFAFVECQQQRIFVEKYNFDVLNDLPLPGRYEWVQVVP